MKKIILALACAFSVIVAKASDSAWFSGSASGTELTQTNATWSQLDSGVEVAEGVITLDLDTNELMTLTPTENSAPDTETKTSVNVTANFYPNALEDLDTPAADTQTALAVAYATEEGELSYYAWNGTEWVALSGVDPVAAGATEVTAKIELDYYRSSATKARFTIGGTALKNADNEEWLPLTTQSRAVNNVAFAGSGKLKSVASTVELGVASVDGVKYPTYAAAIEAAGSSQIVILRESETETLGEGALADYKASEVDNVTYLVAKVYVAQVGDTKYETLAEAVAAAKADASTTLKLLANVSDTLSIASSETVTLNENGFSLGGLTGSGTLVVNGDGSGTVNSASVISATVRTALKNSESWTGVFEFKNCYQISPVYWLGDFGNQESTVRYSGTCATYLKNTAYSDGAHNVGTLEIAANSKLKINGTYNAANVFSISSKLIGSGTLEVGIAGTGDKDVQFTGDVTGFAGAISWASDTTNTRLVIGSTEKAFVAKSLVVGADAQAVVAPGKTWQFTGGAIVDGKLTVADSTSDFVCKYSPNYLRGSGTVVFAGGAVKSAANFGYHSTEWTGTTEIGFNPNGAFAINNYGVAGSTVKLKDGFTGHISGGASYKTSWDAAFTIAVNPNLEVEGTVTFNNGWQYNINQINKLSGSGTLVLSKGNTSDRYDIADINGFTGTINVTGSSLLKIGNITTGYTVGSPVLKTGTKKQVFYDTSLSETTLNGKAATLFLDTAATQAGLYKAVAKIGTAYYATYADAVAAYTTGDIEVLDATAGNVPAGWTIENGKLTKAGIVVDSEVGTGNEKTFILAVPKSTTTLTAATLINTANRATGDQLKVYDKSTKSYYSWQLAPSGDTLVWDPLKVIVATDAGQSETDSPEAGTIQLTAGQGVWVTVKDDSKTVLLNGQYAGAEEKVAVALETGWNLVAPPPKEGENSYSINSVVSASADGDRIVVPTAGVPYNLTKGVNNKWGYYKITTTYSEEKKRNVTTTEWVDEVTVPSGTGFWYINGGDSTKNISL